MLRSFLVWVVIYCGKRDQTLWKNRKILRPLASTVNYCLKIVNCFCQLCCGIQFSSEIIFLFRHNIIFFYGGNDVFGRNMLRQFWAHGGKGNGTVITWVIFFYQLWRLGLHEPISNFSVTVHHLVVLRTPVPSI